MKKLIKALAIGLGFGVLSLVLTPTPIHPQHVVAVNVLNNPLPVKVTNTPLPVTSSISGTPNVNVANTPLPVTSTISGTPNVNVTNTPLPVTGSVSLSGNTAATPLLVRNVDEPARHPYRDHCSVSITPAFFQQCTITVPAGEAVVVQTESMEVRANNPGTRFLFDIQTPVNGPNQPAILQDFPDSGFSLSVSNASAAATLTAPLIFGPGATVLCIWTDSTMQGGNINEADCTLSGYFVTVP